MRVIVYPADDGGCGNYRLNWPAKALQDQGYDVEIVAPMTEKAKLSGVFHDGAIEGQVSASSLLTQIDADLIVLQRPLQSHLVALIPVIQKTGVKVVVEIDDDFTTIHPHNVAWKATHPRVSPHRNWQHLSRALSMADWVTVSTAALADRYGSHGRFTILPNYVPQRYLDIPRPSHEEVYVGWTGSIITHPYDLQETRGAVARVLQIPHTRLGIVGTGQGIHRALGLASDHQVVASDWVDLYEYPKYTAELDVGIVPLEMTAFNNAKSWLKGLEYASLGIPFVASPTGPYLALAQQYGLGHIAKRTRDWDGLLKRLVTNHDFRQSESARYREVVCKRRLIIEERAHEWWDAWSTVLDHNARKIAR